MKNAIEVDPLTTLTRTITPRRGLSVVDEFNSRPRPSCVHPRDSNGPYQNRSLPRDPAELLCPGAAVGLDGGGVVRHIRLYNALKGFVGFVVINLDGDKVFVWPRGIVVLRIPGLKPGMEGSSVYAVGPNDFTLEKSSILSLAWQGFEIGKLAYIQPDMIDTAAVAFKSFDDRESLDGMLNLHKRPHRRRE